MKSKEEIDLFLEKVSNKGMIMRLGPILKLCEMLGNPQNSVPCVHIAGTNGKGSVLAMTTSILEQAGFTVGRFFSPAVFDNEPAVSINGKGMSESERLEILSDIICKCEIMAKAGLEIPTAFEIETLAAYMFFKKNNCDISVIECGMGGKDDATNIIGSECEKVCAVTSVGLDHMKFLGETEEEIALNKSGIFTENSTAVCGSVNSKVLSVLERSAEEKGCKLNLCGAPVQISDMGFEGQSFEYKGSMYEIPFAGRHQINNGATALEVIFALREKGFEISDEAVKAGLKNAVIHGRFEKISDSPVIILDGAHNVPAAKAFADSVGRYLIDKKILLILGILEDKQYKEVIKILAPMAEKIFAYEVPNPRALCTEKLEAECGRYTDTERFESVEAAVKGSLEYVSRSGENTAICAVGSFYSLNDIRKTFDEFFRMKSLQ